MTAVVGMTNINDGPPKGWIRIQMEPIDVPLEADGSILFSIIQSSIPGAHSLYYKENGVQKALKYDSTNGRVCKPYQGWDSNPIFVNIAHGCRPYGKKVDAYTVATERFEKSVELVQKMLAGSYGKKSKGLDNLPVGVLLREKGLLKKGIPKEETIEKDIVMKDENIKKEITKVEDGQMKKLENEINELKKSNVTLEKELKECKEWMMEAKKIVTELRENTSRPEKECTSEVGCQSQVNTLENIDSSKVLNESHETKALQFENDTLKQELAMAEQKITELQEEISKKDFTMNDNRYKSSQIHPTNLYTNQPNLPHNHQQFNSCYQQNSHHFYQPPMNCRGFIGNCCNGYPSYLDNPLYKAPYEEELNLKRKQLELADNKIQTLEAELEFEKKRIEKNDVNLRHGFLIKKQPCGLRNINDILTTDFLAKNGYEMKRTWFEIELPWKATDVFIVGSFTNWECALKCNPLRNSHNKYGIWCDVPKGTHEFKFIADGAWIHSTFYQACSNDFKTLNNFISVN
ncbi:Immunoglobulin E-set domain-containing protein [Strongyloides ratti]|uniref:5'-AMP-activated protein kinase subunit beta-1 n=1 Tax=Strongyloides ratti TaxID=34506 RepID=A0A090L591_STRRB|nr:Immunoglobulin E-set domain-containing protein [Strongyloides ratti]CEF62649.1 Immunoglobulin E-set domain-containing protein [Strongyloides ratti]